MGRVTNKDLRGIAVGVVAANVLVLGGAILHFMQAAEWLRNAAFGAGFLAYLGSLAYWLWRFRQKPKKNR